jgi:hypothetical protein
MRPGSSAVGTVTIANAGDFAGVFHLSKSNVTDLVGPNGGKLSGRLGILIEDVTRPGDPTTVYSGTVNDMETRPLGTFAGGERRTYRFTATLPDGGHPQSAGAGDNAYQASSMSVQFDWSATAIESSSPPPVEPPPPVADTTAPAATLAGARFQRLSKSGALVVPASCHEACWLTAVPKLNGPSAVRRIRLKPVYGRAASGASTKLTINLPRAAIKAITAGLRARRKVSLTLTVTAADAVGNRASVRRVIRFKR